MSVSANIQIPHLKKGQLLSEWSKDYLRATVMLDDTQRIQLLPSYVHRTRGEKSLAESVSELTNFTEAINQIKKFIDPQPSHLQLTKQFYDIRREEGDDCTSVFFELYNKGTEAEVPTDMIVKRFLTLFKGSDKFYEANKADIKLKMSKVEMTAMFGKFKQERDKKTPIVVIKEEPSEENYAISPSEEQPAWAKSMQEQLNSMQNQIRECRTYQSESSSCTEVSDAEEVYQYNKKGQKGPSKSNSNSNSKRCKTCQRTGHSAEKCWKRICENCKGKGHSDFECSSYRKKKNNHSGDNNQQQPQKSRQA